MGRKKTSPNKRSREEIEQVSREITEATAVPFPDSNSSEENEFGVAPKKARISADQAEEEEAEKKAFHEKLAKDKKDALKGKSPEAADVNGLATLLRQTRGEGGGSMVNAIQVQTETEARLFALSQGNFSVDALDEAYHFSISYKSHARKACRDEVDLLDRPAVLAVLQRVVDLGSTKRRRLKLSAPVFLRQAAERSPSVFWSCAVLKTEVDFSAIQVVERLLTEVS